MSERRASGVRLRGRWLAFEVDPVLVDRAVRRFDAESHVNGSRRLARYLRAELRRLSVYPKRGYPAGRPHHLSARRALQPLAARWGTARVRAQNPKNGRKARSGSK